MAAILLESQSYLQTLPIPITLIILVYGFYCYYLCCWGKKRPDDKASSSLPTAWPVIGMIPALLQNAHRLHEYGTRVLMESGGTFQFKGPWFANMDMVATCDPANIHHILSKNFSNYPKGPEFKKKFDILGDGIFNSDSELWELHRKATLSVLHHPNFQKLLENTLWQKMEKALLPILDSHAKAGAQFDLQDILQRFTFDSISKLVLDHDPGSLSMDLPNVPCLEALNDAVEAMLHRHILPESCWKLQKWLGVGIERKLSKAWDAVDQFIYPCIDEQLIRTRRRRGTMEDVDDQFEGQTAFVEAYQAMSSSNTSTRITNLFLRDVFLNLLIAGRDTTSTALAWFFFLVATNPGVEAKILQEIESKTKGRPGDHDLKKKNHPEPEPEPIMLIFKVEDCQKLVYLHGVLCESLRLYPPVALEHKTSEKADILPCGLRIEANTQVVMFLYSMGRMESIWGEDCGAFKPERWITERGRIRHEPSYKFPAFNAGPRSCVGKEMSFVQMKMVAASIIYNYHVQVVKGHPVVPSDSVVIQMKHGLKVRLSKRKHATTNTMVSGDW